MMTSTTSPAGAPRHSTRSGLGKQLLRTIRAGALATLDRGQGSPFASLVTVATDVDGSPAAPHCRASAAPYRAISSGIRAPPLLLAESGKGDPARPSAAHRDRAAAERTERRRRSGGALPGPASEGASSTPISPISPSGGCTIQAGHLNGGFARAAAPDRRRACGPTSRGPRPSIEAEAGAVAHMNEDHRDALELYATRLAGAPPAPGGPPASTRRASTSCSATGRRGSLSRERVTDPGELRRVLKELADRPAECWHPDKWNAMERRRSTRCWRTLERSICQA